MLRTSQSGNIVIRDDENWAVETKNIIGRSRAGPALDQNPVKPVSVRTRANLLASLRPKPFSLGFRHCLVPCFCGPLVGKVAAQQHDGDRGFAI